MSLTTEELINGYDTTTNIVNCEIKDDTVYLYKEIDGKLELEKYPM